MKHIKVFNNQKVPVICIDPSLEKYRDKTPFPEKLAIANEMLKNARLPNKKPRN